MAKRNPYLTLNDDIEKAIEFVQDQIVNDTGIDHPSKEEKAYLKKLRAVRTALLKVHKLANKL